MSSSRRALVVFTRSPEAEARAKGFRPDSAVRLFHAFLASWVRLARDTGTALVIAAPAACRRRLEESAIAPEAKFFTQRGARFGDRLAATAADVFREGYAGALMVGGDAPAIGAGELRLAFDALEAGETVLGPARDGGVYLVGLRAAETELLRSVSLRNSRICADLADRFAAEGAPVLFLSELDEIDTAEDSQRLWSRARFDPRWMPYRRLLGELLRENRLIRCPMSRAGLFLFNLRLSPRGPPSAA